jgi:hypothetical protein
MYTDNFNPNVPGMVDGRIFVDKQIHVHPCKHVIPISIAANTGDLDKGTIMGVSTADDLYRQVLRTTVLASVIANPQVINVAVGTGVNFTVGQTVSSMKADGTTIQPLGTITAINGDVITVSTALTSPLALGDYFYVSDGSQKAVVVLAYPIMDADSEKIGQGELGGVYYQDQLVGLDSIAIKDLGARQIPDNILVIPV